MDPAGHDAVSLCGATETFNIVNVHGFDLCVVTGRVTTLIPQEYGKHKAAFVTFRLRVKRYVRYNLNRRGYN